MQILFLASPLVNTKGGALTVIQNLLQNFSAQVRPVYLGSFTDMAEIFRDNGADTHAARPGFEPVKKRNILLFPFSVLSGIVYLFRHRRLFARSDVIVQATSFTEVFTVLPWLLLFTQKPVVVCVHTACRRAVYANPLLPLLKYVWKHPQTTVVYVSQAQAATWQERGICARKPRVVHNGTKVSSLSKKLKRTGSVRFAFVGRIHREKGLETLLEAFSLVSLDRPAELLFVGDGADRAYFTQKFAELTRALPLLKVRWVGFVPNPKKYLRQADFTFFPSKEEAFGLGIIESWERGVAVIASDLEVFKEIHQRARISQELLFKTQNPADLARIIQSVLDTQILAKYRGPALASSLHETVERKFSVQKMTKTYEELFAALTKAN